MAKRCRNTSSSINPHPSRNDPPSGGITKVQCPEEQGIWAPHQAPQHPRSCTREMTLPNTWFWKPMRRIRNEDGGVEGHALIPSCEYTRITASCWTVIDRKTLELTKKDTPHLKTKEKPQWDGRRGTITVKSNPITGGCMTHRLENTYTTEVHPLEWSFWAPRQASQTGGPTTGGGIARESDFEASWDLIAGLQQDWGKQRPHSWRAHTK